MFCDILNIALHNAVDIDLFSYLLIDRICPDSFIIDFRVSTEKGFT